MALAGHFRSQSQLRSSTRLFLLYSFLSLLVSSSLLVSFFSSSSSSLEFNTQFTGFAVFPTVKLATTALSLKVRITLFTRNYVPLIPCALECKSAHFHYWSFSIQMNIQIKSRLQSRLLYTMHSRRLARLVLLHLL